MPDLIHSREFAIFFVIGLLVDIWIVFDTRRAVQTLTFRSKALSDGEVLYFRWSSRVMALALIVMLARHLVR